MSYLEDQADKMSNRGLALLAVIPSISFVAGGYFFSDNLLVIFIVGLFLGAITLVVVLWRDRYVKKEENFNKGLKGEQYIEKLLSENKTGNFSFIPDIKLKYGNADFVVISKNGVFCIDVKNVTGKITYDKANNCLLRNYGNFDKDYLKQVKNSSFQIHQIILDKIKYVQPILVFSSFGVSVETGDKVDDVYILKPEKLVEFLKAKTGRVLDREMQNKIYKVLIEYKDKNS